MTTIAYDGYDLAADSQITSGTEKVTGVQKIFEINYEGKKCWVAFSGTTKLFKDVMLWTKRGCPKPEPKLNGEVDGILIDCENRVMILVDDGEGNVSWDEWSYPVAIGSGGQIALGAMLAGKSAKQAVIIASKVDTLTGGPVSVVNINKRKSRTKSLTKENKDGLQSVHSTRSVEGSKPAPAGRRRFR